MNLTEKTKQLKETIREARIKPNPAIFQKIAKNIGELIAEKIEAGEDRQLILEDLSYFIANTLSCTFKGLAIHTLQMCLEENGFKHFFDIGFKTDIMYHLQENYLHIVDRLMFEAIVKFLEERWLRENNITSKELTINEQFIIAVTNYDIRQGSKFINFFIENGVDINSDCFEKNPLAAAAEIGRADTIQILIDHGADVNAPNASKKTPLMYAVKNDHKDAVQVLIDNAANIQAKDINGSTVLHYCMRSDDSVIADLLVNHGVDVNERDNFGYTALHDAARSGNEGLCEFLINRGAEVNVKGMNGLTPLMVAEKTACHKLLVKLGAEINCDNNHGETALLLMLKEMDGDKEDVDAIKSLVRFGANVHQLNHFGQSALFYLEQLYDNPCFSFFVDKGLDIHHVDNDGRSLLMHAAYQNKIDDIHFLVGKGFDVNQKDFNGSNALFYAFVGNMESYDEEQFYLGVEQAYDITEYDMEGVNSNFDESSVLETVVALVNLGIDVTVVNKNGLNVLDVAKRLDLQDDVELKDTIEFLEVCFENLKLQSVIDTEDELEQAFF